VISRSTSRTRISSKCHSVGVRRMSPLGRYASGSQVDGEGGGCHHGGRRWRRAPSGSGPYPSQQFVPTEGLVT
jgi:hypothetical protein